jgi:hypothetical protein
MSIDPVSRERWKVELIIQRQERVYSELSYSNERVRSTAATLGKVSSTE